MQNLYLFSIKNKIDLESTDNLFRSNLFYECSFIVNNKIIHHSTVDSLTLYKRDDVLRFMNEDSLAKHSGGKDE